MRLEFEPNVSALPFVENEVINQGVSSEVERMLREGVKAAQEGNRAEARKMLLRVTETDENNENAWLWLASISEYPEELLVFLNNVLRVNPSNERALEWHKATKSLLAKTLVQRGVDAVNDERKDFARQCFEQALEHEAENEMAWLWLASVADSEEEKTACFEKVLSVNPDNETALVSLKSIQSQKTQKLFETALSAAFDGRHDLAMTMLETVLSQNAELEDAWILKSHLAYSFEERAECFLKLRVLNPENEMAKANLASWRMLADKVAAQPKAEEVAEVSVAAEAREEVAAEFAETEVREEVPVETFGEEAPTEEVSAEFSDYPSGESFAADEPAQEFENLSAETEDEDQVLEFSEPASASFDEPANTQPQPAYFTEEDLSSDEFAQSESPTQELSFDSNFQPPQAVDFTEQEFEQPAVFEAPADEPQSFYQEFQNAEVQFESDEPQAAVEEFASIGNDLAAELEAEEDEMHWAFNETKENQAAQPAHDDSFSFDESDEIHQTQSQEIHETQFQENSEPENYAPEFASEEPTESAESFAELNMEPANEEQTDDWKDTSPSVFVNYSPTATENSFEADAPQFSDSEPVVAETSPTESSVPVEVKADAPEMFAENNYLHQFAENAEEPARAEEVVEAAEEVLEAAAPSVQEVEEQVPVQAEEVAEIQPKEEYSQSKAEMVLCPFCNAENEKQAFSCGSCQTILTLSDLEMLLNQQNANQEKLQQAVSSLERENESYGLNAEQLASLGVGQINLKNYRQGFFYLQEAVRMNPSNVLLDAQVNALAIRLSEIEEQQSVHDSMPKNRKILVVDDSPTVRKLISGKLEKCGHEVICAVDGLDALEKINTLMPDLILLDITMPRMDGYQVCKMIRNNETTKDVPVVMISGKDGFFDKVRGRMAGTSGYITKPFGPETLMKTVETYLN